MFIKNANPRCRHRHHELFLPSRPYRGEPPTVAGFLLYPDTPAKMETTSQSAFCMRPLPQQSGGKGMDVTWSSHQEPCQSHPTVTGQRGVGNSEQGEDEENHNQMQSTAVTADRETLQMQSQYQKDFPPPSSSHRRRTPALPQPDNIGINPAFRFEFSTVNMVDFPHWSIINPGYSSRPRATVPRKLNSTSES